MDEIWRAVPIEGLREKYEVSNLGNLRSIPRTIISRNRHGAAPRTYDRHPVKARVGRGGYLVVALRPGTTRTSHTYQIHRLVAAAFIPNPERLPCVDHLDTDRQNNRADNLRWCTHKENSLNPRTRQHLTAVMIGNQRSKGIPWSIWPSGTDAARALGLGWSNILKCANPNTSEKTAGGFVWKYL